MPDRSDVREDLLLSAFVSLTDTLVRGFDVVDLLEELSQTCVRLLGVTSVGILFADPGGTLRVVASSDETTHHLELLQVQNDAGPCVDCFSTGRPVEIGDLADAPEPTSFARAAVTYGFRSVCALPLRLRDTTIGAVNLLRTAPGVLPAADRRLAQALADVATIAVIQHRIVVRGEELSNQLQGALVSRVTIEQAKGLLAERAAISFDEAFALLRTYARARGERLTDVAASFIEGSTTVAELHAAARRSEQGNRSSPA
jgi:GAF domain-containing protein